MAKMFFDMLEASGQMLDTKLEPTDETTYLITVKNRSRLVTANGVMATIFLAGGPVDGIKITPDDRFFGTIPPRKSVTKEISILTERAPEGTQQLCYHLNFTASFEKCEGEQTEFTVERRLVNSQIIWDVIRHIPSSTFTL